MQSFKYHQSSPSIPLSIYQSTTTHKAIQIYNLTKEDLDWERKKLCIMTLKLIIAKNLVGLGAGIKGILTPLLCPLDCWQSAPTALHFEACAVPISSGQWNDEVPHMILCIQGDHHNNILIIFCGANWAKSRIFLAVNLASSFRRLMAVIGPFGQGLDKNISCQDQGHLLSLKN